MPPRRQRTGHGPRQGRPSQLTELLAGSALLACAGAGICQALSQTLLPSTVRQELSDLLSSPINLWSEAPQDDA